MDDSSYKLLKVTVESGVATVTIDNPPINLLSAALTRELVALTEQADADPGVRVLIFKSADPDFFLSHADVHLFLQHEASDSHYALEAFRKLAQFYRSWDKVTIAQVEGRASGGGTEFLEAMDMRFAAIGKTFLSHPEVSIGFMPCKGGSQRLPELVGRARALEIALGGAFVTAEQAETYGLVNRALVPAALGRFVQQLARRIATSSWDSVRYTKRCINAAGTPEGHALEKQLFDRIIATDEAQRRLNEYNDRIGQQRNKELRMGL
ncbi:MAG TPA: enoyl-CoA hydratase/isomerase family protein [Polyangiales bacterium]|nr:enoyl-CoA hydratase/isomerase family protein [Polyangiales bacterium]